MTTDYSYVRYDENNKNEHFLIGLMQTSALALLGGFIANLKVLGCMIQNRFIFYVALFLFCSIICSLISAFAKYAYRLFDNEAFRVSRKDENKALEHYAGSVVSIKLMRFCILLSILFICLAIGLFLYALQLNLGSLKTC